jgi:elongation factor G
MDRPGADFARVVETKLENRLGAKAIPIQLNIGSEENFDGVVDLIKMQAIYWTAEDQGMTFRSEPIPAAILEQAKKLREQMVESAAESSEVLMEKYLEGGELTEQEIKSGLRHQVLANEIVVAFMWFLHLRTRVCRPC